MIYLDNSATTKQYDEVTEIMLQYMRQDFGNPSSLYQLGVDTEKAIKNARKLVLKCAGLKDYEVVFTSGGTEADNMACFGIARALKRWGNKIITTEVEHPAVLESCKMLEKEGFQVVRVGVDKKCRINMKQMENAIDEETILVTMMHVNNEVGTVMPVEAVRKLMIKKNAPGLLHCDAVQSFGKMPLPGCADLLSVSGHKIHGPKGSGALLISKGKLPSGKNINIQPFIVGGGQESGKRSGTENVAGIVGLGKAAEIAAQTMKDATISIGRFRQILFERLRTKIDGVIVNSLEDIGDSAGLCCPTILNVSFEKVRGEVLLHTLEQDEIYVSTGSACSSNKKGQSHVLKAMGLSDKEIEGTVRFSFGRFNKEEEIELIVEKVAGAVMRFRKFGSFR